MSATSPTRSARRGRALDQFAESIQKYFFLRDLQDTNETLFYAVLVDHLEKMLPLVYTPTVGEGCQRFSEVWRKPRGLFLSYPNRHKIREILADPRYDEARIIVVSDGERILGLGDQGAGGMGIPIGKLSLYTGCAGIHPNSTLPILLDVGTNNQARLDDPLYVGWRHERITGAEYDAFIEEFVSAATLLSAINVGGAPLKDQRIAILGAGSAGTGIAALIKQTMIDTGVPPAEAKQRFFLLNSKGLITEATEGASDAQRPFLQPADVAKSWTLQKAGVVGLADVVANVRPSALIGVSGQAGAFTEAIIRDMAAHCDRPVVLALSNPTDRSEATPADLMAGTDGRALIGTGSPFAPVKMGGVDHHITQTNNSYIFPGVGLGVLASGARRVSDGMFMASALALAELAKAAAAPGAALLPQVKDLRAVAAKVALAVGGPRGGGGDRRPLRCRPRTPLDPGLRLPASALAVPAGGVAEGDGRHRPGRRQAQGRLRPGDRGGRRPSAVDPGLPALAEAGTEARA
jgi:malate dehydrogenase (oxaloacetate-decarboxylating)